MVEKEYSIDNLPISSGSGILIPSRKRSQTDTEWMSRYRAAIRDEIFADPEEIVTSESLSVSPIKRKNTPAASRYEPLMANFKPSNSLDETVVLDRGDLDKLSELMGTIYRKNKSLSERVVAKQIQFNESTESVNMQLSVSAVTLGGTMTALGTGLSLTSIASGIQFAHPVVSTFLILIGLTFIAMYFSAKSYLKK